MKLLYERLNDMSVTIKDVAKKAQVAPSTVSRVIANSPQISEKTKRKVRKIMDEMGYHINVNARNLAIKSTQTIGIVMPSSTVHSLYNPFFPEVIRGISAYCHLKEYSITLTTGESKEEIYNDVVQMVQGRKVDAIIVLYSSSDDAVVPYLHEKNFPFVLIGKPFHDPDNVMYVDNDNYKASRELTEYLIQLGHKRIAFITGDIKYEVTKNRLKGFQEALFFAQLDIRKEYIKHISLSREEGRKAVDEIMKLSEPPTAFIVADELVSLGVLSALRDKQIKVPDDISVANFNNTLISELASPPLTTVDVNIFQLGYEASKAALEMLENPDIMKKHILVPTKIIVRETCKKIK